MSEEKFIRKKKEKKNLINLTRIHLLWDCHCWWWKIFDGKWWSSNICL